MFRFLTFKNRSLSQSNKFPCNILGTCNKFELGKRLLPDNLFSINYFYSDNWVPLSMYTTITRFWMENFKFLAKNIINESHLIDSMVETFLTLDPDTSFIQTLDVNFSETRIDNQSFLQIDIITRASTKFIIRPVIPKLHLRVSYTDVERKEKLWNTEDFYNQHDQLVSKIWENLKDNEREAYSLGYAKRRGKNFSAPTSPQNSPNKSKEIKLQSVLLNSELERFFQS